MFLVEPESGQQCLYSSARALGAAIRRGELGPQARIFHRTANQWLPITVHPEYQRAEWDWEQGSTNRLQRRRWTFLQSRPDGDQGPADPDSGAQLDAGPLLIPGDGEPSWLSSAFRHLLQLARPGI